MKVFVGLSGGVDSSVTAALLKEQGHEVVGVYMKNWATDLPGFECPWREDYMDAKRVAVHLGIDFKMYDFQKEYKQKVVDYMIDEYKAGRTPNPDIMCNQEVKFKLFLSTALEDGADMIATGHYARIDDGKLFKAKNKDKDQTYFLYRVTKDALRKSLMPIGDFNTKQEVRDLAEKFGLPTAKKKDSQGICFVGKVGIREFLEQYVSPKPGRILDQNDKEIGQHDGAIFYTIGQRSGLGVGGGLPYYVVGKDMDKNEVYVSTDLDDKRLWLNDFEISGLHWIGDEPDLSKEYTVCHRYRAQHTKAKLSKSKHGLKITLKDPARAITAGQSMVIYDGDQVLGGGIIT
ncbi:MAG: tRNA 2-thiouridine(34) synthase MnmA [Patescibacteria group bacterium]|mgnify:CR=1 FL=1